MEKQHQKSKKTYIKPTEHFIVTKSFASQALSKGTKIKRHIQYNDNTADGVCIQRRQ